MYITNYIKKYTILHRYLTLRLAQGNGNESDCLSWSKTRTFVFCFLVCAINPVTMYEN